MRSQSEWRKLSIGRSHKHRIVCKHWDGVQWMVFKNTTSSETCLQNTEDVMWPTPGSKPGEVNKDIRDVVQIVDHAGNLEQNSTWLVFNSGEFGFQKTHLSYQLIAELIGRFYHQIISFLNNFLKRDFRWPWEEIPKPSPWSQDHSQVVLTKDLVILNQHHHQTRHCWGPIEESSAPKRPSWEANRNGGNYPLDEVISIESYVNIGTEFSGWFSKTQPQVKLVCRTQRT